MKHHVLLTNRKDATIKQWVERIEKSYNKIKEHEPNIDKMKIEITVRLVMDLIEAIKELSEEVAIFYKRTPKRN